MIKMIPKDADLAATILKTLWDGEWHYEQGLVLVLAQQHGMQSSDAFDAVIRFWHVMETRIERGLDTKVGDFRWKMHPEEGRWFWCKWPGCKKRAWVLMSQPPCPMGWRPSTSRARGQLVCNDHA